MNRKARRTEMKLRPTPLTAVTDLFAAAQKFGEAGQFNKAIQCFQKAVRAAPDLAVAHYNLGNALAAQARTGEAIDCFRRAVACAPGLAEAHCNLGAALKQLSQFDAAETACRKAIELAPGFALAHFNLGTVFEETRRLDDAAGQYRAAIGLQPGFAEAHLNLAMTLLATGDMTEGWREYEWRWKTPQMISDFRKFPQPQWRGEPAQVPTLLIHAEQGFGDTLQFCRYASLAAARGFRVVLEVPKPLVRLLRSLSGVDQIVAAGEALPEFDVHAPMLSLPMIFATTVDTVPAFCPYLHADPAEIAAWQSRIAAMPNPGKRVGLVWAGNSARDRPALVAVDRRRSVALEQLAAFFEIPGLQFFSLQKDQRAAAGFPLIEPMAEIDDFAGTAALIATLDLVISVDTSVAHLAGALGKPVWLLNRFDSDWRWLDGARDSLWYPTMRIYTQPRAGDWDSVIAKVTSDLRHFAEMRRVG